MVEVKRLLIPVNGMGFDKVRSFRTESYCGVLEATTNQFILFLCDRHYFVTMPLGSGDDIGSLEELDQAVFQFTGEHITGVSGGNEVFVTAGFLM